MRQIFSVRFLAAVGAVVGLFFLLTTVFAAREAIEGGDPGAVAAVHTIDLVDRVASVSNPLFDVDVDGRAVADTDLVLDPTRVMTIVTGTPGEMSCPDFPRDGRCAVVADLLGEGVVWFALVPMSTSATVRMPAIDTLDAGVATLVNGWRLPYAPVLDRRCSDEFVSYREFRRQLGDDFTSIYDLDRRELTAVECRRRVPYAPTPTSTPTSAPTSTGG
ncbi:MAG TPA: hypothetical protein VIS05_10635 [Ilumatobacter sp.]